MSLTSLKLPLTEKLTLPAVSASFLQCTWLDSDNVSPFTEFSFCPLLSLTPVGLSNVEKANLLTKDHDVKPKIEVFLNIEKFTCNFLPGDTIGIFPVNPYSEVEELVELLELKEKHLNKISIDILPGTTKKNASVPKHLPQITTVKDLLSKYLEIRAPVKKLLLRSLCSHTLNDNERRRLEELSSKECAEDYMKLVLSENVTLLTILKSFRSCKPPIGLILEHLPAIKPRVYSIASSPLISKKCLRIVITVIKNDSGSDGVCSGYLNKFVPTETSLERALEELKINNDDKLDNISNSVRMFFRQPNNFRYPEKLSKNLILIGPGSGVAPFIGFLEHKKEIKDFNSSLETWLFFGCRNENDYLYREQLADFLSCGVLTKLFVSFSRLSVNDNSPKYVQDNILCVKEDFVNLLLSDATLMYLCGDARNMVKDVLATVNTCLQQVEGLSENDAGNKINELIKAGVIITDSWL